MRVSRVTGHLARMQRHPILPLAGKKKETTCSIPTGPRMGSWETRYMHDALYWSTACPSAVVCAAARIVGGKDFRGMAKRLCSAMHDRSGEHDMSHSCTQEVLFIFVFIFLSAISLFCLATLLFTVSFIHYRHLSFGHFLDKFDSLFHQNG